MQKLHTERELGENETLLLTYKLKLSENISDSVRALIHKHLDTVLDCNMTEFSETLLVYKEHLIAVSTDKVV